MVMKMKMTPLQIAKKSKPGLRGVLRGVLIYVLLLHHRQMMMMMMMMVILRLRLLVRWLNRASSRKEMRPPPGPQKRAIVK